MSTGRTSGSSSTPRRWLEQALAKGNWASAARAKALDGVGWLALDLGDMEQAVAAAEEGLKLRTHAEVEASVAASLLRILGVAAEIRGDYEKATELSRESLALGRAAEDKLTMVWSLLSTAKTKCQVRAGLLPKIEPPLFTRLGGRGILRSLDR